MKKISGVLKNLTSQKNIELYKKFLKFLNPLYLMKVWKDNSISVINKIKTSIPILLLLIWILIPGGSKSETRTNDTYNIDKTENFKTLDQFINEFGEPTEKVKQLQDKIEEWNNYPFNSHVINSDRNTIYSRFKNSGIISGVYTKWSSYSNSRRYEYIITPQFANGNYGTTVTKSITMSKPYTKEGFELYKKSKIESVFKQIDEQLELEKKQKEDRNAMDQKNNERKRKRRDYVKKQKELIENKKDSILKEIDIQKNRLKSRIDWYDTVKDSLIPELNFQEGDTLLYYNNRGNMVPEEKRSISWEPKNKVKYSYGIDNQLLGYPSDFKYNQIKRGNDFFTTFDNLELLKKQFSRLENSIEKLSQMLDSNSKSFDEVKDEWEGKPSNNLSSYVFNEKLLRSYRSEMFMAETKGYDYVYSPLRWKVSSMIELTNKLNERLSTFYENQNYIDQESYEGFTDLLSQDLNFSHNYMKSAKMVSKFLVWYQNEFYNKVIKPNSSGLLVYKGREVEKFIKCISGFDYENKVSTLINYCIDKNYSSGKRIVKFEKTMIFSLIKEIYVPGETTILNIDYNKLNECLEKL